MQTGKMSFLEECFDLNEVIHEIVENLQAATSTHHLDLEETAHVHVMGDKDRIGQVLINLITNAIKYSPQADTVIIQVAKDQENALISVQDFGIGIAEAHQQKVFERFYQVVDPEEKTYPGLGIGLYISHQIIQRHQGCMWVKSKKGAGATFYFTLPLAH
jgi:signal transduction histidine kinase